MFPIIPYFYPKKNYYCHREESERVILSYIQEGAISRDIFVEELLSECSQSQIRVKMMKETKILQSDANHWGWLRGVKLAEDCHNLNFVLCKGTAESTLALKSTRKIEQNDGMQLWFSNDLLQILQIPVLFPQNIKGDKLYVCHKCGFEFEKPNPLKIHLALDCYRQSMKNLWSRLADLKTRAAVVDARNEFDFSLRPLAASPLSAFKPYVRKCVVRMEEGNNHDVMVDSYDKQAAEMESIVSNLGRFGEGHLCIYCGKMYSRKYGLKIHIRTHTGFKPLKCKYCSRPFGDPSNLNKHIRLHSDGENPYKCELCGKIMVRKRDLDRHFKSRHKH